MYPEGAGMPDTVGLRLPVRAGAELGGTGE